MIIIKQLSVEPGEIGAPVMGARPVTILTALIKLKHFISTSLSI